MKKKIFAFFGILVGTFPLVTTGQTPSLPEVSELLTKIQGVHPRLLVKEADIRLIEQEIPKSKIKSRIHADILQECDRITTLPQLERIQTGKRLLHVSRESLRRVFYLSYAFKLTGEEKYLKRAEQELVTVCNFSDWNPSHFLDVAEMTMSVAIGYDWLFPSLSKSTKDLVKNAITQKGILPSYQKGFNWFVEGTNNWNQVCHAGMLFGALAVADDFPDLSAMVIHRAIKNVPKSMQFYAPDGAYPEGYMYWDYGTSFNVLLIDALEKAFGTDFGLSNQKGFLQSATYLQHMVGPGMLVHNWGDCFTTAVPSPAVYWFAKKTQDPTLLWYQSKIASEPQTKFNRERILPALLIWAQSIEVDKVPAPEKLTWMGQGKSPVGLMRTSWTDPDAFFVGFKTGAANVSHAHMDAGSFVIDAKGERWAVDFGMQNYHSLESKGVDLWSMRQNSQRWQVFRYNNFVHNTLTINDQLHVVNGNSKIERYSEAPDKMFFTTDLKEVLGQNIQKANRGIMLENNERVIVRDEIVGADESTKVRWTLLTPAKARILNKKTIELTQNGKTMYVHCNSNVGLTLKTWTTVGPNSFDDKNGDTVLVGFETNIPGNQTAVFDVVFSEKKKESRKATSIDEW